MRAPRTLAGRLFLLQVSVVLLILLALGLVLDRVLEHDSVASLTSSLASQAGGIQQILPAEGAALQSEIRRIGEASGVRMTVIGEDGAVLADSAHDPATMENHSARPEMVEALAGQVGTDTRKSATTGEKYLYVAVPPVEGRVVRVAVPLTEVQQRRGAIRGALLAGLLAAALAAIAGVLLVTRWVSKPMREMSESVARLGEGGLDVRVAPTGPEEMRVLAGALNDMAERLSEEVATSHEAQRSRDLILSSMDEGILLLDAGGTTMFSNPALARHLGTAPTSSATLSPAGLRDAVDRAAADGATVEVEVETGTPSRWLRGAAVPVDPRGAVLLVLRDITNPKRLEAVRRDFVANASHELKTPAATIQVTAETIKRAVSDDPQVVPRFADQLEREAVRLSRIVSDLLDLSRLETATGSAQEVDLDALVREEASAVASDAAGKGVALAVESEPAHVRGSERDLSLLVRNLLDNALGYTSEGGSVHVTLSREDDSVVLRVADTGVGIPSRDLARVFERFYRVDRARSRETGGTGLGLSIVKHVTENHGGTVAVESELGRGSTFTVRIPMV